MTRPTIKIIIEGDLETAMDNISVLGLAILEQPVVKDFITSLFKAERPGEDGPIGFKQSSK